MEELFLICLEEDSVKATLIDEPLHKSDLEGKRVTISPTMATCALHSPRVAARNAFSSAGGVESVCVEEGTQARSRTTTQESRGDIRFQQTSIWLMVRG